MIFLLSEGGFALTEKGFDLFFPNLYDLFITELKLLHSELLSLFSVKLVEGIIRIAVTSVYCNS